MDEPTSFGYWVRRRRKALDLTQGDLARKVGCAEVTIQKIEADERRPSRQIAELLAEHLQIPPDERAAFLSAARGELMFERGASPVAATRPSSRAAHTSAPPHNLPIQLTSFIGRSRELAATAAMLAEARLLTLTGPGGSGKTRLALELAGAVLEQFPDGVWLLELAPLADPALIVPVIAAVLEVREDPGRPLLTTLTTYLRERRLLLILDNCEHLIDACAQVSTTLLQACPRLRILASSREPLGIAGEAFFRVPALPTPDPHQLPPLDQLAQYEAVQLFIARTGAGQTAFELTASTAAPLAQICARLDGIPLAIELAAARTRVLTVEQIAARLDDRFRLLTGGSRTALPRHQTLQALIDWSYDLLSDAERTLLRRLAVFAGGWTLEAAEAICVNEDSRMEELSILDDLTHLVDKSLVQVDQAGDTARYRMLETIRQYAMEKLASSGEADAVRQRHAGYYLAFAETDTLPRGEFSRERRSRIKREHDNLRAALAWSQTAAGESDVALRLVVVLAPLLSWSEARIELERTLNHPRGVGRTLAHARARFALGVTLGLMGDFASAQAQHDLGIPLYRELMDQHEYASVLFELGRLARERGDALTAWARLEASCALYRDQGDQLGVAAALMTLAEVAILQEDAGRAQALLEESWRLSRRHGNPQLTAWTFNHQGHAAQLRADYDRAIRFHTDSLALFQELFGDQTVGVAWASHGLGEIALAQDDLAGAAVWLRRAMQVNRQIGDRAGVSWCLAGLGSAAAFDEEPERAARLWGASERLRAALGCRPAPAARATYERAVALARAQLSNEAFAAAWAAGAALSLDEAIAEALRSGD